MHNRHIEDAKRLIISGRPEEASLEIKKLIKALRKNVTRQDPQLKSALSHLENLAEAGRAGVLSAREKLVETRDSFEKLPIYDQNGTIKLSETSIKKTYRF